MNPRTLSIISNLFKKQLNQSIPLEALISQAQTQKVGYIELRQTCLGSPYEEGEECVPNVEAFRTLHEKFPNLQFNFAIALPFMNGKINSNNMVFRKSIETASLLGTKMNPVHLRLVDPISIVEHDSKELNVEQIVTNLSEMTQELHKVNGVLSIENTPLQDWDLLWKIFTNVNERLKDQNIQMKLVYDPCNVVTSKLSKKYDPNDITPSLQSHQLQAVHIKQSSNFQILEAVQEGDVDWKKQIECLKYINYQGDILLENASSDNLWENLSKSVAYLQSLGLSFSNL